MIDQVLNKPTEYNQIDTFRSFLRLSPKKKQATQVQVEGYRVFLFNFSEFSFWGPLSRALDREECLRQRCRSVFFFGFVSLEKSTVSD